MATTKTAPAPTKRRRKGKDKQEAILSAALSLFVSRGFHGTAMPLLAKTAGVAAGTIYHYFASKEILVNVLFRHWKGLIAQRIYTGFPHTAPPREQFRAIWMSMAEFALENPEAFAFLEYHHHGSYLDEESRTLDRALKQFGEGFVVAARDAGVLKDIDAIVLMELTFGAFNGMMRAHYDGRIELTDTLIAAAEQAGWDLLSTER